MRRVLPAASGVWPVLAVVAVLLVCRPSTGRASATGGSENVDVNLVSERTSIRPGEPVQVGFHMKMKRGWHTYWKQPGDAGLPLRIEWALPAGFAAGPIEWPTPERIPTGELMSYGYGQEVLFGVTITPPARVGTDSVTIAGTFDWLECKDVCLSGSARLEIALPVGSDPPRPGPASRLFAEARSRMPGSPRGWSLAAAAGPRAIELSFRPPPGVSPRGGYLFVDQPLVVAHAAPQGFERAGERYRLTLTPAENAAEPPKRITGVLVLEGVPRGNGDALAVDVDAFPGDPAPAPAQRPATGPWSTAPVYAIVGVVLALAIAMALRRRGAKP
jgi:thiol:disulfide interchange protein DsbD